MLHASIEEMVVAALAQANRRNRNRKIGVIEE